MNWSETKSQRESRRGDEILRVPEGVVAGEKGEEGVGINLTFPGGPRRRGRREGGGQEKCGVVQVQASQGSGRGSTYTVRRHPAPAPRFPPRVGSFLSSGGIGSGPGTAGSARGRERVICLYHLCLYLPNQESG
jgi:hypothetical protein